MDKLNMHKLNNKLVNTSWSQMLLRLNHGQLKFISLTFFRPFGEGSTIFFVIYFMINGLGYIKIAKFFRIPNWKSQKFPSYEYCNFAGS